MASRHVLGIKNFGPMGHVEIPFADVSVLVGPQATGKSLALQWLKLAVDARRVLSRLKDNGYDCRGDATVLLANVFGAGYGRLDKKTRVTFDGQAVDIGTIAAGNARAGAHALFYIPAHRALLIQSGWPLVFRNHSPDTPFVAREFATNLIELLEDRDSEHVLVPPPTRLRQEVRERLDNTLFHGGHVIAGSTELGRKELRLQHGEKTSFRLMEWTTGQREVVPLVLGMSWALPAGAIRQRAGLKWLVVEEPELGLHPDGTVAVMAMLLEAARRGYRLVVSTHAEAVLEILWVMSRLRGRPGGPTRLCRVLGIRETQGMKEYAAQLLKLKAAITYLDYAKDGKVTSTDITDLDPASETLAESEWGGLLKYASRAAEQLSEDA